MYATTEPGNVHLGRNIKRIREILKVKQQSLATDLGDDWTQKKISQLEDKEVIDDLLLDRVAKALNISVEAIKEFDDNNFNIIATNNNGRDNSAAVNFQCNFNPLDKLLEVIDKNEKLYERLLQSEKEKVALLEKVLDKK